MKARLHIAGFDTEGVEDGRVFAVLCPGWRFVGYRSHGKTFKSKKQVREAMIEPCACEQCCTALAKVQA